MRLLAPILFGTLFAVAVSMFAAQLANDYLHAAHLVLVQP